MLTLYLPLLASSQSAETPCASTKRWSVPSVYFTCCCFSPRVSPVSYFLFVCLFASVIMLSLLSMFFLFGCSVNISAKENSQSKERSSSGVRSDRVGEKQQSSVLLQTSVDQCGRTQETE